MRNTFYDQVSGRQPGEAVFVAILLLCIIGLFVVVGREDRRRRKALAQRTGLDDVEHPLIREAWDVLTDKGVDSCQTLQQLKEKLERARQYKADARDIAALRRMRRWH